MNPKQSSDNASAIDQIWKSFASVKLTIGLLLTLAAAVEAAPEATQESPPADLTALAAAADLVALAQVRDTDYRTQRDIPVSGSAFLRILIAYKADRDDELVEVIKKHDIALVVDRLTAKPESRKRLADSVVLALREGSGYEAWGGTSMATPHVAGVAALLWSARPDASNIEIRQAMTATALDLGVEGRDIAYGFGLVQAYDALQYLQQAIKPGKGPKSR